MFLLLTFIMWSVHCTKVIVEVLVKYQYKPVLLSSSIGTPVPRNCSTSSITEYSYTVMPHTHTPVQILVSLNYISTPP
jgi:hypothetical protein